MADSGRVVFVGCRPYDDLFGPNGPSGAASGATTWLPPGYDVVLDAEIDTVLQLLDVVDGVGQFVLTPWFCQG